MNPRTALIVAVLALVVGGGRRLFRNRRKERQRRRSGLGCCGQDPARVAARHDRRRRRRAPRPRRRPDHQERGRRDRQAERVGGQAPNVGRHPDRRTRIRQSGEIQTLTAELEKLSGAAREARVEVESPSKREEPLGLSGPSPIPMSAVNGLGMAMGRDGSHLLRPPVPGLDSARRPRGACGPGHF